MASDARNPIAAELQRHVHRLNQAWIGGQPDRLGDFFHEDMAIVSPDFKNRLEGRAACVASYREFVDRAKIRDFAESSWSVDVIGDTAVVSYRFAIGYAMDGQEFREGGRDLFVLQRDAGNWLAVWRMMAPDAPEA